MREALVRPRAVFADYGTLDQPSGVRRAQATRLRPDAALPGHEWEELARGDSDQRHHHGRRHHRGLDERRSRPSRAVHFSRIHRGFYFHQPRRPTQQPNRQPGARRPRGVPATLGGARDARLRDPKHGLVQAQARPRRAPDMVRSAGWFANDDAWRRGVRGRHATSCDGAGDDHGSADAATTSATGHVRPRRRLSPPHSRRGAPTRGCHSTRGVLPHRAQGCRERPDF
mmetsp:Transcript_14731/g.62209  ORF Transcript_14731/g.62209 Transcript_14731/m.62209 type:complete len:228 (+) Transcript_14731:135-818(+)